MKQLRENGIYSLALTPFQYIAKRAEHYSPQSGVAWLLMPAHKDIPLISGPPAYVTNDGRIGVKEGLTEYTIDNLDFTGRYE